MPTNSIVVDITESGCWISNRAPSSSGHVHVRIDGKHQWLHRLVYEALIGPIPDDHDLHHEACENPPCCNPWHMRVMPHGDHTALLFGQRTHCKHGHEYTKENTYWKGTVRICRICQNAAEHRYKLRRKQRVQEN